jgi:uncharacterized repeat protein (TIGR01451 family)
MRAGGKIALVAAMLFVAVLPAVARADETPWGIGAAQVDTTPAAFNTAQDLVDFPEVDELRATTCLRSVYDGPRLWRFEEPYQDTDMSADYNYPDNGVGARPGEPFCDYNHNNRWDGIYLSGGVDHRALTLHDPIDARAVAFSDGIKNVVLVSVVAQGIFENYIAESRAMAQSLAEESSCGQIDEMVVSSNHNESSPDTVGIYGAPAPPPDPSGNIDTDAFGLHSGIDEYYMDWLDEQMANVAVEACDNLQPASLREVEFDVPADMEQEIPNRFPTRTDSNAPGGPKDAAIDPKVRVLQARDTAGDPIFTMMNLADHNQDIGHSDSFEQQHAYSSDWPGYFHDYLEADVGGMAMFLAADIGSMEDLITRPRILTGDCDNGHNGCFPQVQHTGDVIAGHVADALANAQPVPYGPVDGQRTEFCVPLENNLFLAAFEAGLFGERHAWTDTAGGCVDTGSEGSSVHTSVAVLDVGPDLQFLVHPGEEFPGLVLGTPFGIEDASCANRANPPAPTWHARARYRFQVGLGDDLIGYLKPAWSFLYDTPGGFTPTDCLTDPHSHSHALEDESVGWTAGNVVAEKLTEMLDQNPDPTAEFRVGRYVKADGSLTDSYVGPSYTAAPGHFPTDAVAIWLTDPGMTSLNATSGQADSGTIVALDNVGSFGGRPVDANGEFMDFDGAAQADPNVSTRGMLVRVDNGSGTVMKRYYVDVYPALTSSGSLGASSPPAADLALTQSGSAGSVSVGSRLTYSFDVTNQGPQSARDVTLTDRLPKSVRLRSARTDHGHCKTRGPRVVACQLSDFASGESATVTIQVRPTRQGTISNTGIVQAVRPADPVLVNNAATVTTSVDP